MKTNDKPSCLRLMIPLTDTDIPILSALHFGWSIGIEIRKQGGKARCFKRPDLIVVEMSGISRSEVDRFTDSVGHSKSMNGANLKLIVEERDAPEIDLEGNNVIVGEFHSQRLTKKFLFGLPDGAIIVGNLFVDGVPHFTARLETGIDRSRIWKRAINLDAAQRVCSVYWNPEDVMQIYGVDLESLISDDSCDSAPPSRMWD